MPIRRVVATSGWRIRLDIDGRAEGGGDALDLAVEPFRIGPGNPHAGLAWRAPTIASCIAALSPPSSANPEEMITAFLTPTAAHCSERAEHRARRNDDDGEIDRLPDPAIDG